MTPAKMPEDIISGILDYADKESMMDHLQAYQRRGEERRWEDYRKKIPTVLLNQWIQVVNECRINGFINPIIVHGKLTWAQIIGDRSYSDQCTVCPKKYVDGSCEGKSIINKDKFDFIPCWQAPQRTRDARFGGS